METYEQLLYQLHLSYLQARKNKRNTQNQIGFEINQEENLAQLATAIYNRNYIPKPFIAFIIQKPVMREIFAADFSDRVVHHLIYRCIYPFIDKAELKAQVNVMLRIKFAEDLLRKRNENLEILIKMQTAEFQNIEERYLKVSGYALEYFWEVDQSGQFTYVSPVIAKILGFDSEEIVGIKSLYDFCSYNEDNESKAFMADIFARRENFTGNEILCLHKNGKKVWLTISGFPIFDGNNNFAGYIGVNHDITRRREAEEANKKHLEKINEYQKKLKSLNYELTVAEEKERRKIAEYLHDGLGQTISIVAIKLSAIARGGDCRPQ